MPTYRDLRKEFGRRTYNSIDHMLEDLSTLRLRMRRLREDDRRGLVTRSFRERLMLAVTSVNECRYCSWAHARVALKAGVTGKEVKELLCGTVDCSPVVEGPALLYALHWAEQAGSPDPEARETMVKAYGEERAAAIERALRTIWTGNLIGNTIDYVLFRLTLGRVGGNGPIIGARSSLL